MAHSGHSGSLVVGENSYVTVNEASDYFGMRIAHDAWSNASTTEQSEALVTASLIVDRNEWIGQAVSSSQALAWPRKNAVYYDRRLGMQITIPESEGAPLLVKEAVYEQALHLLNYPEIMEGATQTFESISVGSISLTDSNGDTTRIPVRPNESLKYIRDLVRRGGFGQGATWWRAN